MSDARSAGLRRGQDLPRDQVVSPVNLLLQAYLFCPSFSSDGRWAIFDPSSKRSFLLSGKDNFPPLLDLLLKVNRGNGPAKSSLAFRSVACVLRPTKEAERLRVFVRASSDYLSKYQLSVSDYRFFDYSSPEWRERDSRLMLVYGSTEKPPSNFVSRKGRLLTLSPRSRPPWVGDTHLRGVLARALALAISPIGKIPGYPYGPWLRRTSPSGGARHPTEAILLLPVARAGLSRGAYYFDSRSKRLIADPARRQKAVLSVLSPGEIGILLTSRVERAMWRYREPRALRPVVIDSGHVALTIAIVLGGMGFGCSVESLLHVDEPDCEWLRDLPLALIRIATPRVGGRKETVSRPTKASSESRIRRTWLLNPTAYLSIEPDGLTVRTLWPKQAAHKITREEFLLLTHCIFSRRGDRDTAREALLRKFPRVGKARMQLLLGDKVLQPAEMVKAFLKGGAPWIGKGWYLSLLAYLADAGSSVGTPDSRSVLPLQTVVLPGCDTRNLKRVLLDRRTTRRFTTKSVARQDVQEIEESLLSFAQRCSSNLPQVFFNLQRVRGVAPLLYELRLSDGVRVRGRGTIPAEEVRRLTIGQAPAGSGALSIWLIAEVLPAAKTRSYVAQLLSLGVWGQVLCLKVTQLQLGVFLTPAARDSELLSRLGIGDPDRKAVYGFSVGVPT